MLARRALIGRSLRCKATVPTLRSYSASVRPVAVLLDNSLETFRANAYEPATPALLPRKSFEDIPALSKWFQNTKNGRRTLNRSYFQSYGSTIVPLEISNDDHFSRTEQSLSFFLECVDASSSKYDTRPNRFFTAYVPGAKAARRAKLDNFFTAAPVTRPVARIYLAQAPISNLPQGLKDDVPTPELVLKAGKGDVYDSSIWLGEAPTFTPLHRDPNPNLFVQLAGTKVVRLLQPKDGHAVFAKVQEQIGGSASASLRGTDMMHGAEKNALQAEVWNDEHLDDTRPVWEAKLRRGDGLFIPRGWWHSVQGVGTGMTGSVNWWFR